MGAYIGLRADFFCLKKVAATGGRTRGSFGGYCDVRATQLATIVLAKPKITEIADEIDEV